VSSTHAPSSSSRESARSAGTRRGEELPEEEVANSRSPGDDMRIEILGTESLGVRGLSCVVEVENRKIVIDPGLALGYRRHGLLPHPAQVAVGEQVRRRILAELRDATDVVMSHFHGDHVPLPDANPYQLKAQQAMPLCRKAQLWIKGPQGLSDNMLRRRESLGKVLGRRLPNVEGQRDGPLAFSLPVPHGRLNTRLGTVMMTRIAWGDTVFVHASDIQLLDGETVSLILDWQPDIVLVGGPPLYLARLSSKHREIAWKNARRLARHVDTLILDHHLLRCEEGLSWLNRLSSETGHSVICAADFMKRPRRLLEARREQLYEEIPVPKGWHEAYACGDADTRCYRDYVYVEDVTQHHARTAGMDTSTDVLPIRTLPEPNLVRRMK
jgi:predicted metallo-beta-lactamase superfamily hydrolase